MPVLSPRPVDRGPAIGTSAERVLSCRLYGAGRDCRHCLAEQAHGLRHSLPSHCRHPADHCCRPQTPWSANRFLCSPSHLGTELASPPPPPLRRSRRRPLASVPSIVSEVSGTGLRLRPTPVLRLDRKTARPGPVSLLYRSAEAV